MPCCGPGRGGPSANTKLLYPYTFMDPEKLGVKKFCLSVTAVLAGFFLLGCLFVALGRWMG